MSFLLYYAIFAVTTGIVVCYDHLSTVITLREQAARVDNKFLLYLVTFLISVLLAPLLFLSCIVPKFSVQAKLGLYQGLFED